MNDPETTEWRNWGRFDGRSVIGAISAALMLILRKQRIDSVRVR